MGNLFLRSKRLILIVGGIAALAGGPAATVATALPDDGGASSYDCKAGKAWFDQRVGDYNRLKDSNPSAAAAAKKDAQYEKDQATRAGCDTSGWTVPLVLGSTSFYVPPSGTYGALPSPGPSGSTTAVAPSRSMIAP
jgi:hypothetical protein